MGVNSITVLLGVLAAGVLLANGLLGEGWLADVIDGGRTSGQAEAYRDMARWKGNVHRMELGRKADEM